MSTNINFRNHNQINQVIIQGYLTKTPEVKTDKNGREYCFFSIGIQRYDKRNNETYSNFFYVRTFQNCAVRMKYFKKGDLISITGYLDTLHYMNGDKEIQTNCVQAEYVYLSNPKTQKNDEIVMPEHDFFYPNIDEIDVPPITKRENESMHEPAMY